MAVGGLHDRDIGYAGGDNDLYGYCLDDPVNGIDPLGLEGMSWGGDGRGVLAGPKIGNFCGKDWTGGQNPNIHGGDAGVAPPTSSMDEACENHDYCYRESPNSLHKKKCDETLVRDLELLPEDPRKWNKPPPEGTEDDNVLMRKGALWWFK